MVKLVEINFSRVEFHADYDGGVTFSFYGLEISENLIRVMVSYDL